MLDHDRFLGRVAELSFHERCLDENPPANVILVHDALEAMLADARTSESLVVLLDTYERMTALGGYLRRGLLPSLPERALIVIAGRGAPEANWFAGGCWASRR